MLLSFFFQVSCVNVFLGCVFSFILENITLISGRRGAWFFRTPSRLDLLRVGIVTTYTRIHVRPDATVQHRSEYTNPFSRLGSGQCNLQTGVDQAVLA